MLERADLAAGAPAARTPTPSAPPPRRSASRSTDEEIPDQLRLAATFLDGPWRARAAAATGLRREVGFALALDAEADDAPLINGVIDLMVHEADGRVLVIDHKTDRVAPDADLEALVGRDYAIQRAIYALAALRAGASAVEVVHLYLERGEAAVATYAPADEPGARGADPRGRRCRCSPASTRSPRRRTSASAARVPGATGCARTRRSSRTVSCRLRRRADAAPARRRRSSASSSAP